MPSLSYAGSADTTGTMDATESMTNMLNGKQKTQQQEQIMFRYITDGSQLTIAATANPERHPPNNAERLEGTTLNLVEVDKVLEFVNKEFQYCSGYPNCGEGDYMYECAMTDARNRIKAFLKAQPTVEAAPVVHGRWIMRGGRFRCSECDAKALWRDAGGTGGFSHEFEQSKTCVCPNCAAKMDL